MSSRQRLWIGKILSMTLASFAVLGAWSSAGAQTRGRVYVSNTDFNISAYDISAATGALTPIPGSPFNVLCCLGAQLSVTPNGKFLYRAEEDASALSGFVIDANTGALSPVPGDIIETFDETLSVTANDRFLYAAVTFDNVIRAFAIDATTGALAPVPGTPFAADVQPWSLAMSPNGKFVFAANRIGANVSVFAVDATSGALTPVPGSPFALGPGTIPGSEPLSVTVHPSGRFIYVASAWADDVTAFTVDAASGALTPVLGSPFAGGTVRSADIRFDSVAVTPDGKFAYLVFTNSDRGLGVCDQRYDGRPHSCPWITQRDLGPFVYCGSREW